MTTPTESGPDGARRLALVGATGLVGAACLRLALEADAFDHVVTVSRRPPAGMSQDPRLEARVVDFARLAAEADAFRADAVICALGTTMRAAGSREAFRRVDHDLPIEVARLALEQGTPHFLLVTAIGADPGSRVFYNRVKGEVEAAVLSLPFRSITILRPSLLVGERREPRMGERIGRIVGVLLPGRLRPVRATDVARVLLAAARTGTPGARILESDEIRARSRAPAD